MPADRAASTPSGDRADNDVRHRLNIGAQQPDRQEPALNVNLNTSQRHALHDRTGRDDNGDLVFNDRPAGVGRNTRADARAVDSTRSSSTSSRSGSARLGPGGITGITVRQRRASVQTGGPAPPRYRIRIRAAQNLTNHVNYTGYSGNADVAVLRAAADGWDARKIDVGINFSF